MGISAKVKARIQQQLRRYRGIIQDAHSRDISESDTVRIIADMLSDVLGYDRYSEVTTEFAIRGTFVDLAVRTDDEVRFLVEAKAIGEKLKENHARQAIDYAANQGIEWVLLSNAADWQVYRVQFRQPIDKTLVFSFNLLDVNLRDAAVCDCLETLSREGFTKSSMTAFYHAQQAISRYTLAALLLSDSLLDELRKEIRRKFDGVRVELEFLREALANEVIKRELVDGDEAQRAAAFLKKTTRAQRTRSASSSSAAVAASAAIPASAVADAPQPAAVAKSD
jgi:predicted type IV restriction endonuclease